MPCKLDQQKSASNFGLQPYDTMPFGSFAKYDTVIVKNGPQEKKKNLVGRSRGSMPRDSFDVNKSSLGIQIATLHFVDCFELSH